MGARKTGRGESDAMWSALAPRLLLWTGAPAGDRMVKISITFTQRHAEGFLVP